MIALTSLMAALLLAGTRDWPTRGFERVAVVAIVFGVSYTAFSEWLNVSVRRSWAYSDWMPVIPIGTARIGLSPLFQWIVVPATEPNWKAACWPFRATVLRYLVLTFVGAVTFATIAAFALGIVDLWYLVRR